MPSGIGPEGYVTIPERNLLVSANETDDAGARAHVMLFEYQDAPATYPHLTSAGMDELTGWGAISGQVMAEDGTIYAVSDSFTACSRAFSTSMCRKRLPALWMPST